MKTALSGGIIGSDRRNNHDYGRFVDDNMTNSLARDESTPNTLAEANPKTADNNRFNIEQSSAADIQPHLNSLTNSSGWNLNPFRGLRVGTFTIGGSPPRKEQADDDSGRPYASKDANGSVSQDQIDNTISKANIYIPTSVIQVFLHREFLLLLAIARPNFHA